MGKSILLLGGGAREHAIAYKICQNPDLKVLYVYPGNAEISFLSHVESINQHFENVLQITNWCHENQIDLVIVGPEKYLEEGISDNLASQGIPCFGPNILAANLEIHKSYAKDFMNEFKIPTATYNIFVDNQEAINYINKSKMDKFVVKADGLAGGKGVIIAMTKVEAINAANTILKEKKFGPSSSKIVIEEFLTGPEISCLAFMDGTNYELMPASQDHKRAFDGDKGPNTGGMGAYSPCPLATPQIMQYVKTKVFDQVMVGLKKRNIIYKGVLYAGLMITPEGIKVLEFNCRFGDPETQVILPLLKTDLLDIMGHCAIGTLKSISPLQWETDTYCTGVVLAAKGYPETKCSNLIVEELPETIPPHIVQFQARKGRDIISLTNNSLSNGISALNIEPNTSPASKMYQLIFDAGTQYVKDPVTKKTIRQTNGIGRIFTVVGVANSLKLSAACAYDLCNKFSFVKSLAYHNNINNINGYENHKNGPEYFYRSDIGAQCIRSSDANGNDIIHNISSDASKSIVPNETECPKTLVNDEATYGDAYAQSGVDIAKAERFIERIAPRIKANFRPEVLTDIGGFAACFALKDLITTSPSTQDFGKMGGDSYEKYDKDSVLVASTDGVGSKLKVAIEYDKLECFSNLGVDLVAMTTNDILASGAECLFFLDYIATASLDIDKASAIVDGIITGCTAAKCCLVGGETAEMPSLYSEGDFDLAGFGVGIVERENLLPAKKCISEGDIVIGLKSSGFHSNGFSLIRKIVKDMGLQYDFKYPWCPDSTLGEFLLKPTIIYHRYVLPLIKELESINSAIKISAFAHITGGGLLQNLPRVLPAGLTCHLDALAWHCPPVYAWFGEMGRLSLHELAQTFNLGLGGVLVVSSRHQQPLGNGTHGNVNETAVRTGVLDKIREMGLDAWIIGTVVKGKTVQIINLDRALDRALLPNYKGKSTQNDAHVTPGIADGINNYSEQKLPTFSRNDQLLNHTSHLQTHKTRVAVFISGTGSNLKALIEYSLAHIYTCAYSVNLVISNKETAPGLAIASKYNIPNKVFRPDRYPENEYYEAIEKTLQENRIEFICLAGFMRILSPDFVSRWQGKLINIHPSLLPSFRGLHAPAQALKAGCKITGSTVHYVAAEVDSGSIIAQTAIPIEINETVETLTERIKVAEHKMYPQTLDELLKNLNLPGNSK